MYKLYAGQKIQQSCGDFEFWSISAFNCVSQLQTSDRPFTIRQQVAYHVVQCCQSILLNRSSNAELLNNLAPKGLVGPRQQWNDELRNSRSRHRVRRTCASVVDRK